MAEEVLWQALRPGTLSGRLVPVLAGSAYHHRGVEPLLDAVVALLPSPRDRGDTDGRWLRSGSRWCSMTMDS